MITELRKLHIAAQIALIIGTALVVLTIIGAVGAALFPPAPPTAAQVAQKAAEKRQEAAQEARERAEKARNTPPSIEGVNLARADQILKDKGWSPTIVEDDVAFGVTIRENFTVCDQKDPKGRLVPIKVAKRGC